MRVLNLVTTADFPPFAQQVAILDDIGVRSTTLEVPGERRVGGGSDVGRSPIDYLRLVPRALRHSLGEYDLIHANYGLTLPIALLQPRLPVVVTLWGSDLMGTYGRIVRECSRRADAVIVRSEEMATHLPRSAHVIPHGVDFERFKLIPRGEARQAVGWEPEEPYVLFPYAQSRPVKDYPRAKAVVDTASRRLGEPIHLETITDVPHDDMVYYFNAANALLLTSRREGSPNAVKEAMACNVPVVSTAVGDVPDLLGDVRHSYVFDRDDELTNALVRVLQADARSNGRNAIDSLSIETEARKIKAIYDDVVQY